MRRTDLFGISSVNETIGTYLALGVAALFASACEKTPTPEPASMPVPLPGQVQCLGIHECKGQSACHVAGGHACAGLNSCKGKGWIAVTRAECDAKGGKVQDG